MNAIATNIVRPFAAAAAAGGQALQTIGTGVMRFTTSASRAWSVLLGRTTIDYAREVGDPTKNSIIVAVVGWIARNFPEAPVRIQRLNPDGSGDVIRPAKSGPGAMLRLLERPNPYFSGVLQWIATTIDLYIRGDAYWVKVRNAADRVVELWWVPYQMIRPFTEQGSGRYIDYYIYRVDGVEYRIETRDVIHYRDGIDPNDQRRGLSRLASLFREIFTDDEGANFTAVLLKNFAVPGVILAPSNTGGPLGKVEPETVKSKFLETFGGDERGSVMALSSPTDIKVLSWSPQQLDLKALRRVPEERITSVLGVTAIVVGLGAGLDRSTFTNFGEARLAAYIEAIVPLQRIVSAELEIQLLPDFADTENDNLDVDFDTSKASALQDNLNAVWTRTSAAARSGLITRAAFKQATGQPVDPSDEVYILPNNFLIVPAGGPNQPPGRLPPPTAPAPPAAPPPTAPPARRGEAGGEVRCVGDYRGKTCDALLAERAGVGFRATCRKCGHVTEIVEDPVAA